MSSDDDEQSPPLPPAPPLLLHPVTPALGALAAAASSLSAATLGNGSGHMPPLMLEQLYTWRNDSMAGPQDSHTSEMYIVLWLSQEGHYERYRGGGETKNNLCNELAATINGKFKWTTRDGKSVMNKIESIEKRV